jgi:hypothetical protein
MYFEIRSSSLSMGKALEVFRTFFGKAVAKSMAEGQKVHLTIPKILEATVWLINARK